MCVYMEKKPNYSIVGLEAEVKEIHPSHLPQIKLEDKKKVRRNLRNTFMSVILIRVLCRGQNPCQLEQKFFLTIH